jgi:hypothetical protein
MSLPSSRLKSFRVARDLEDIDERDTLGVVGDPHGSSRQMPRSAARERIEQAQELERAHEDVVPRSMVIPG